MITDQGSPDNVSGEGQDGEGLQHLGGEWATRPPTTRDILSPASDLLRRV